MIKFKNDSGKWITKSLFFELTSPDSREHAVFTLKEDNHTYDGVTYISLKRLYMSCEDPTEWEFANKHLGGWQHWKTLQESSELVSHVESWREEKEVYYRSIGIKSLLASAEEGNFQASKWLADKGWDEVKKRGRPSKQEVKKETEQQAKVKLAVMSDYKRLKEQ